MMQRRNDNHGFTLLEALAASVILGAGVVVLCQVSSHCMSQVQSNRQCDGAWRLLDRQLTAIGYMGIDEFISENKTEGQVDSDGLTYSWRAEVSEQPEDVLYLLKLTVWWSGQGRVHTVSAATMFDADGGTGGQADVAFEL